MEDIVTCGSGDYGTLAGIWERSVRATHDFLSEADIASIGGLLVRDYFPNVELYALRRHGVCAGFVGLSAGKIEMLFVDSPCLGLGIGSALMDFAKSRGAVLVDVNEQNPAARRFYEKHGFRVVARDATDDAGRPFPILRMALR